MKNNMIKLVGAILMACSSLLFVSCGKRVEVPPAHVGVVKTADGIESTIHEPSSFRLPWSMWVKNQLVLVETSHFVEEEEMRLFMPMDKLNFQFDIKGTYSITKEDVPKILEKVKSSPDMDNDVILNIDSNDVYRIYVQQLIRTKVRSIISGYSIEDVIANTGAISQKLFTEISEELQDSPIRVIRLALADIQPPEVIVKAHELTKEREIKILQAEAQKQIQLKEAEASLEVARKQQEIDVLEAETQVLVELKISESVSPAFVTQRALRALDTLANSNNKVFFLPLEALTNPQIMIGMTNHAMNNPISRTPLAPLPKQ